MSPIITQGYISKNGQYFDKVREIAYKTGELYNNLGTLVAETKKNNIGSSDSFSNDTTGVLIYQSNINPNVAYRIYKDYADCGYYDYNDYKFIQKMMERQLNISLTKFPTGVVTLDGNVIGQEVPYFYNSITVYDFLGKYKDVNPIKIYRGILEALKEMYENGILYLDIHPGNFMINPNLNNINIDTIDFEEKYLKIDDFSKNYINNFFENYKLLIENLNRIIKIDNKVPKFLTTDNFDDIYSQLDNMEKVLVKNK